jgi:hypothetical protein
MCSRRLSDASRAQNSACLIGSLEAVDADGRVDPAEGYFDDRRRHDAREDQVAVAT